MLTTETTAKPLLEALSRRPVSRPPVWLMRQAGRYLPQYQALRAAAGGFGELLRDPELAAEVTLEPVRRFGLDGAILFSDILLVLEALGLPLVYEEKGPRLPEPLRAPADLARLKPFEPRERLGYVGETLRRVRAGLPAGVALLGFAGAPFTLASYAIEGGTSRSFAELRRVMYREPTMWTALLERLADAVAAHLAFQVDCGAEALVLFDTWAASLGLADYRRHAAPWTRRVLSALEGRVPRVLFAGAADHLLEELAELGAEALAIDHRTDLADAFERVGRRVALQGNLDPAVLFAPPEEVARRTRAMLASAAGRPGYVPSLGHGVLPGTEPECVRAFVAAARGGAP